MEICPYILSRANWKLIKGINYELAILPWGATEAHNYHLPYTTDVIQSEYIANASAKQAWDNGAKVMVLPTIPFGVNTGQLDIKFVINIMPSTQQAILWDVVHSLRNQKIPKLLILNGHGGNDFKPMIREIQTAIPAVIIATLNWWQIVKDKEYFVEPGDHGGEMETSNMLYIVPDLVLPLTEAGDGKERKLKLDAFKQGWAWTQREWRFASEDTGIGNPKAGTAEKGKLYLEAIISKIADFVTGFAKADAHNMYE